MEEDSGGGDDGGRRKRGSYSGAMRTGKKNGEIFTIRFGEGRPTHLLPDGKVENFSLKYFFYSVKI